MKVVLFCGGLGTSKGYQGQSPYTRVLITSELARETSLR
jgi:hypothetical protein